MLIVMPLWLWLLIWPLHLTCRLSWMLLVLTLRAAMWSVRWAGRQRTQPREQ